MLLVCGIVSVSAQAKSPKKYIFDTVKTTAATKTVTAQKPVVTAKSVTTTKTTTVQKPVVTAKSATATKATTKTTLSVKTTSKSTTATKAKAKTTATKAKVATTTKAKAKTATTAKTTTTASKSVPKSYTTVKKPAAKVTDKVMAKGTGLIPQSSALIPQSSALPISFNNQMLAEINALRKSGTTCGGEKMPPVKPLAWNAQLEKAAVVHVADMDANDHFSHAGMDGTMPDDRIKSAGYEWERVGENIGQGYKDVSSAMKGWKESTNHCKQMMSAEVTEMGAAKKGKYWCQTFAKPLE